MNFDEEFPERNLKLFLRCLYLGLIPATRCYIPLPYILIGFLPFLYKFHSKII